MVMDLEEYKDRTHYGPKINSLILHNMQEGIGLIKLDNYEELLEQELRLYLTFNYASMME